MAGSEPHTMEHSAHAGAGALDDETYVAHALLVAKAGRPMTVIGQCDRRAQNWIMDATLQLDRHARQGCIPFLVERADGQIEFGYAAAPWVVDLYRWLSNGPGTPCEQKCRILAMLLGYAPESISRMETAWCEMR